MRSSWVYLVQTDTTVGFLSSSTEALARCKGRSLSTPFLQAIGDLRSLRKIGRVPVAHRRWVRHARKTSFVLPNGRSFRYIQGVHRHFVQHLQPCYTTSANWHQKPFDLAFAKASCDVIVEDRRGLHAADPSPIWRLGRIHKRRLR